MDNAVPIVPQAPAAQPLQIPSGVLTQVRARAACIRVAEALLRIRYFVLENGVCFECKIFLGHDSVDLKRNIYNGTVYSSHLCQRLP